jgi:methionyl-tRNA formyltransferase
MNGEKIKIGFLGYGTRALDALMEHPRYDVRYFFAPEKNLCRDVYEAEEKYRNDVELVVVKNNDDLAERLGRIDDVNVFLMNACSIILNQKTLDKMTFFNIHPGSLENNRGHHPHLWPILLGETESEIVLHTVGTGIDEGTIIASKAVKFSEETNSFELLNLLEDEIPYLLDRLFLYLNHEIEPQRQVKGGVYRHVLAPEDYRVDFAKAGDGDFDLMLGRKMRARAMHHGAFFVYGGNRIYIDKIVDRKDSLEDMGLRVELSDTGYVKVYAAGKYYCFHINKIQPEQGK